MKNSSIKKNLMFNVMYQIIKIIIPLIVAPYVSRRLQTEGVGIYSYYYSVANYFIMFAMLGLANYGCREIALCREEGNQKKVFSEIYSMQLITSIIIIILYLFISISIKNNYMLVFALYVFSSIFDISWYYFGKEEFSKIIIINCIIRIIMTFLIFLFVKDISDTILYCIIMSLTFIVPNFITWLIKIRDYDLKSFKINKIMIRHLKNNFVLFIPIIAISVYKTMDKIMLGLWSNYDEVGLYENAEKIISVPMGFISALGYVMLPKISSDIANNIIKNRYISVAMKYVAFIIMPIFFLVLSISQYFVPVFYGDTFQKSADILNLLMSSTIFLGWANIIRTQILIPYKKDKVYIISVCIGALVNFIFNLLLIKKYESIGVSIATVFAEMSVCVYQTIKVRKQEGFYLKQNIITFIKFTIPSFAMFIVLSFIDFKNLYLNLFIKSIIGVIIYLIGCLIINYNEIKLVLKNKKVNIDLLL